MMNRNVARELLQMERLITVCSAFTKISERTDQFGGARVTRAMAP